MEYDSPKTPVVSNFMKLNKCTLAIIVTIVHAHISSKLSIGDPTCRTITNGPSRQAKHDVVKLFAHAIDIEQSRECVQCRVFEIRSSVACGGNWQCQIHDTVYYIIVISSFYSTVTNAACV